MLLTQQDAKALREQIQISGLQEFETEIVEQSRAMCSLVGIEEVEPAEVGITKFGGSPDVPASFAQTEIKTSSGGMMQLDDCVFIFQINFEELQPFAQGLDLPDKGLLSLFTDQEAQEGYTFYFTEQNLIRHPMPHHDCFSEMKAWTVGIERGIDVPSFGTLLRDKIEDAGLEEAYDNFENEHGHAADGFAQLLGLQSEMEWDTRQLAVDECKGELGDWRVLWKIFSNHNSGVEIGDLHSLYGMIRNTDLLEGKFDEVFSAFV